MNIKTGLIGFFDILGYGKLLENNEPEVIVKKIVPILQNLNEEIPRVMGYAINAVGTNHRKNPDNNSNFCSIMKEEADKIKFSIFSDTILLYLPINQFKNIEDVIKSLTFFQTCDFLQNTMFNDGLPLRGCIDYGEYYIENSCFAGKPLINAYKISNSLELSACVLSKKLKNKIEDDYKELKEKNMDLLDLCFFDYLVPTKDGEKIYSTLSILTRWSCTYKNQPKEYVLSSFEDHNKSISISVKKKIENTKEWFEFIKFKSKEEGCP